MMKSPLVNTYSIKDIDVFIFDFDGVLTDNLVHVSEDGSEMVSCSRADGIAFDVLRKLDKPAFIISTEENLVVTARAKKLKIPVLQGINDKVKALSMISTKYGYAFDKIFYVGNDLNDYHVMQACGMSACPADSHAIIQEISGIVLKTNGGMGVVRELLEEVLNLNFIHILYGNTKE
jgi:3-deoxy-D-manno-octulosonate 8-phosphate phosphatase (KDO 8-P phosphatase)